MKKITLGLLLVVVVLLVGLFILRDFETTELTDQVRETRGASFVKLAHGAVAYDLQNPHVERTVVFVHGFSVPAYIWEPTFQFFKQQNYRVLRFDLYGRGFSDRPDIEYGLDDYVEQLRQLLERLEIKAPVHLVGLSMGGPISTRFSHTYPERVKSLSLLAPLVKTSDRFEVSLLTAPLLGDYLATVAMMPRILNDFSRHVYDQNVYPQWRENMLSHIHFQGYRRALLRTTRYLAGKNFVADYAALAETQIPSQLIWGKDDRVVPLEQAAMIQEQFKDMPLTTLDQCGHLPQIEHPEAVNRLVLAHVQGVEARE